MIQPRQTYPLLPVSSGPQAGAGHPASDTMPVEPGIPPLRSILVATDLGEGSRSVLDGACRLARQADADLHVIHVIPREQLPPDEGRGRRIRSATEDRARAEVHEQMEALAPSLEAASVVVHFGQPHHRIALRARNVGADLVVVGHPAGEREVRLGSTADRVLRTSRVPVLILRGELRLPPTHPVVLSDFSPTSRGALRAALAWLPRLGLEPGRAVEVLHVSTPDLRPLAPPGKTLIADAAAASCRRKLEAEVEAAVPHLPDACPTTEAHVLLADRAGEQLRRAFMDAKWDLVFLGTHGRGRIRRALLGSVAWTAVRQAPCPVVVVPPRWRWTEARAGARVEPEGDAPGRAAPRRRRSGP